MRRLRTNQRRLRPALWAWYPTLLVGVTVSAAVAADTEPIDFSRDVQPLLAKRCVACHGPETQEAGLRFDDRTRATGVLDSGSRAIVPGKAAESEILARITSADPDLRMPPEGPRLSPEQIALLRRWIDEGAEWREHWAFRPLVRPAVPARPGSDHPSDHPIDAFIAAGLARRGLPTPQPADRRTLLRRVTYDLTGLPPSEQDVRDFLADTSPDAWERVVDRLLASPHYGEKWARHWLDLVRYADTNSFERDGDKPHAWRYRDYVIRSLNDDKPYDQFVIEQLAGDELPEPSNDALIATGFYRLGLWDDEPADPLQAKYDGLDDIVSTTGQVFLGLTINCARCHDHKIDPLTQRDYYAMLSFFHNVTPMGGRQMNPAFIERALAENGQSATDAQHRAEDLARRRAEARSNLQTIERRVREQGEQVLDDLTRRDLAALKARVAELEKEQSGIARALVVSEHGSRPPDTFVLYRGNSHAEPKPENRVEPAFPAILKAPAAAIPAPAANARSSGRRLALARWIASSDNPLTARVLVNRVWQHHFGRGIVRSASNFGLAGDPPTHPELLDWLAVEFIAGGWRLKSLHKLILMSQAYQATSAGNAEAPAKDPLNDAFWRFDMRRLTAEELRDSIHVTSGAFNPRMFGPAVFPDIPAEVKASQSQPGSGWGKSPPEEQARRSIYAKVKRSLLVPLLAEFDVADTDTSCPVRFVTTQPTQALGMMNGSFLHEQARVFAARIREDVRTRQSPSADAATKTTALVRRAVEVALVRPATADEVSAGVALIERLEKTEGVGRGRGFELYCLMLLNLNEFAYLD